MPLLIKILTPTSIFITFFKKLYIRYCHIELWLGNLFKNSHISNTIQNFWQTTKITAGYSFLGKISDIEIENYSLVFYNSKFIKNLFQISEILKNKIRFYLERSTSVTWIKETEKELYLSPIKIGSTILIAGILTNILFSFLFYKEIRLLGLVMRGLFLIIGLGGLFCEANWEDIRNTSFILKRKID